MTPIMVQPNPPEQNPGMQQAALSSSGSVRIRPIALPSEHGGWGMLGAPVLAGLLVAPTWAGGLIGVAGACAFLTRQPFRLAFADMRRGRHYPRTDVALRFAAGYSLAGVVALVGAIFLAGSEFLIPLVVMAALGVLQFSFDVEGRGRRFIPEVSGAAAMACLAPAIAIAGGLEPLRAWTMAAVLALQSASAISYASARVRLARNVEIDRRPTLIGHLVAVAAVACLVLSHQLEWPILAAFAVLGFRAVWGLSCHRRPVRAGIVGVQEVGYALLTVVCLAFSV